jgi:putative ABC transport system ATP-binding protein
MNLDQRDVAVIELSGIEKSYGVGQSTVQALRGVSVSFARGSFTAIMGPSGSGKSTLLQCAAGLERPTAGTVTIAGQEINKLDETAMTLLRRDRIGFIFQSFNLMPSLTAFQNVELPLRLAGKHPDKASTEEALRQVGLSERIKHLPSELSGGQQQRVAIARALASQPEVLFADEPTGALDSNTGREVLELIRGLVDKNQQTVVMVTHDPIVASYADKVMFIVDGTFDGSFEKPTPEIITKHMATLER